jgi:hypothetical protein
VPAVTIAKIVHTFIASLAETDPARIDWEERMKYVWGGS